jgi:hypothetical protein
MLRRELILIGAGAMFGAMPSAAHEDIRVIGKVTKVAAAKLDVKMKDGRNVSIKMDKQTSVTRDKKKIAASELKAGQSVVVDAYGDGYEDLLALEVRIVPSIAPSSSK